MILILSSSLNADSSSRVLAHAAQAALQQEGRAVEFVDLRDFPLPWCDGGAAYADPNVGRLAARVREADAVLLATPIYNYASTGAVKNLIELTGRAWENKVVGFLCAAGGQSSYMSILSLANSLMLDFRTVVVPRFVYATGDAFADGRLVDGDVAARVADLARTAARMGAALASKESPAAA